MRRVEMNEDVAPVESHSCQAGHRVSPGVRRCHTCGAVVGVPQPGRIRHNPRLVRWLLVAVAFLTLLHLVVLLVLLG